MRRRLVLVLVVASVVGLLASTLVYRVLRSAASGPQQDVEMIVVASVNMSMAETITAQHVKLLPWPSKSVPSGAVRTLAAAEGRVVRGSIVAGEPLLEGKLAPALSGKGGLMPMLVPEGQRGVTIKVDDATKESGFVLPNSRVDVLVSMAKERSSQERISKVIIQDVTVLAAGQTVELRDNKPVTVTTVTLALQPAQVERLALAQSEGKLTLAMRNLRDTQIVQTKGVTAASLLADGAPTAAVAAPVKKAAGPVKVSAPLPPPRVETHAVTVLRGNKPAEVLFTRDHRGWAEAPAPKK
ncbi:MAG TPA: Flp pilus assembly protein CpaB [Methylomirabilota bacterium]